MTKAKTAKNSADAKTEESKIVKLKKDDMEGSDSQRLGEGRTKDPDSQRLKAPKSGPDSQRLKAAEKTAEKAEEKKDDKTPKAAGKKPAGKTRDTDIIPAPVQPAEAKPVSAFLNAGLGIRGASKKPALSLAPDVMTLGRSAQPKLETVARPSDRRLSKKEKDDLKATLLERRERLLAGMRRELAMQKERAESKAADEVDKATDAYDEDLSFEIATANDQELQDITIALEKIEKGTYGECEVCGCAISPSRLKILPSATTCVACRGQEEMARRRDDNQQIFTMMSEEGETETEGI